jgi:hypothetical protein
VPIPAQQITPLSGRLVSAVHVRVWLRADWREGVEETSVLVKRVREGEVRESEEEGGGLRSRIETLAPWVRRVIAVASPRPDEPPEMMKVRSLICIVGVWLTERVWVEDGKRYSITKEGEIGLPKKPRLHWMVHYNWLVHIVAPRV